MGGSSASASRYEPRPYVETRAFRALAAQALRGTRVVLDDLIDLGYASKDEAHALRKLRVRDSGHLFEAGELSRSPIWSAVRERLLDAAVKLFAPGK